MLDEFVHGVVTARCRKLAGVRREGDHHLPTDRPTRLGGRQFVEFITAGRPGIEASLAGARGVREPIEEVVPAFCVVDRLVRGQPPCVSRTRVLSPAGSKSTLIVEDPGAVSSDPIQPQV